MENVLTWLFHLPFLPCSIAIVSIHKFLYMWCTLVNFCLRTSSSIKEVFDSFYLINYAFKVAKLNITEQYLRLKHQWAKKTIRLSIMRELNCTNLEAHNITWNQSMPNRPCWPQYENMWWHIPDPFCRALILQAIMPAWKERSGHAKLRLALTLTRTT